MKVVYAQEDFSRTEKSIIFLAGPTPRSNDVPSWRPEALKALASLEFDGLVLIPEARDGNYGDYYIQQVEWEKKGLEMADVIAFWVPREMQTLPGLTTNVEFGRYIQSGRVVFGAPLEAPHTNYLRWLYRKETGQEPGETLFGTLSIAVAKTKEPKSENQILGSGKWLQLIRRGGWELAHRKVGNGAVCIIATQSVPMSKTPTSLILVEQFRPPINSRVIELPAGLVGDKEPEEIILAAQRELLEETGFTCDTAEYLYSSPSSAGMSDEIVHMVRMTGCERISQGGGVDGEDIVVHNIRLNQIEDWLAERRNLNGLYVDHKIYAALGILYTHL